MKFQKTLLSAALAVASFTVAAAPVQQSGLANIWKYSNSEKAELIKLKTISGNQTQFTDGWYEIKRTTDKAGNPVDNLVAYKGNTAGFTTLVSGGQLNITVESDSDTVTGGGSNFAGNVNQNNYWSYGNTKTTTTTDEVTYTNVGQLVNYDENGRVTSEEDQIKFVGTQVSTPVTNTSNVKKDVQIGNLTEENRNTSGLAKYDFELSKEKSAQNIQGTLATIKEDANKNTSVAAVTGNGLAVLDVPKGAVVDLEKGTVTSTITKPSGAAAPRAELLAYDTKDGKRVVEYGGKYFTLDAANKTLTAYEVKDKSQLTLIGAGTADETKGGLNVTSVNTGLVSNKNVHYGESVTSFESAGSVQIGSTDPKVANSTSGTDYNITTGAKPSVTSKDVVTGIIAEDAKGNKTYGLQATNVVDNKVTGQTTVTADGISTTGDVTVYAGTDKETSVGKLLANATTAIDEKIKDFGATASRLNQRISDVEETAYRGIAISLAAQQQIPNIGAGQTAVFGGVGHYEGESAAALGLATVLADGRTSLSAALGVAGGSEVGGRVGVAYVFGGK